MMEANRASETNRLSRMISTAAVAVVFFAAVTAVASATDYYVRTGGFDNPGHDGLANDDAGGGGRGCGDSEGGSLG